MTLYGNTLLTNPQVYCIVTPPGGCATIISAARGTHGTARQANPNVKNLIDGVTIYPNPTDGNFNIQVPSIKESATATLTDSNGKKLATYILTKGENNIKNKELASGTYIVLLQIDGKQESRQLIIK